MIPDGFQYFQRIYGTSKMFTKSGPLHPYRSPQNISKNTRKIWRIFENIMFTYMDLTKCQFWKRRAPGNDEDPSEQIFKILDMRSISIKKHSFFPNTVAISISKNSSNFVLLFLFIFYFIFVYNSMAY